MSEQVDMERIEEQTRRAFAQDGLMFLFLGGLLFLVGGSFSDAKMGWLFAFLPFLLFGVEAARKHITYPRIGYAKLMVPSGTVKGILGFALIAVVGLSLLAFVNGGQWSRLLPIAIGGVFALSLYFGLSSIGKLRLREWLMVGLTAVSGFITFSLFADWHQAVAWQFGAIALFFFAMGIGDLVRFVRQYPVPSEEIWHDQA